MGVSHRFQTLQAQVILPEPMVLLYPEILAVALYAHIIPYTVHGNFGVSMKIADGLVPIWYQYNSNYHAGPCWSIPVKLPWIFPGAPLKINGAPGNIQGNDDSSGDQDQVPHEECFTVMWSQTRCPREDRIIPGNCRKETSDSCHCDSNTEGNLFYTH